MKVKSKDVRRVADDAESSEGQQLDLDVHKLNPRDHVRGH